MSSDERFHCPVKGCQWFGRAEDFERHVETIKREHLDPDEPHRAVKEFKAISASGTKQ